MALGSRSGKVGSGHFRRAVPRSGEESWKALSHGMTHSELYLGKINGAVESGKVRE